MRDMFFFLGTADMCAGWIAGLLILLAGMISARSAVPRAGYLIGASGALLIARWCCAWVPAMYGRFRGELTSTIDTGAQVLGALSYVLFAVLFLAGAVVLARTAKAKPAGGSK
jgi:hypothetical protein